MQSRGTAIKLVPWGQEVRGNPTVNESENPFLFSR